MRSGSCYQLFFLCDGRSAISDGLGVFRIKLEHLVEVLNSPIVLALVYVGATAIVEGIAVVRIKLDRQVEVLNGAVNLADLVVSTATIIEGNGLVGIKLDRLVEVSNGAVKVAFVTICDAAVEVGTRQVSLIFTARLNHSRAAGNRLIVSAVVSITPSLGWRLLRGSRRNDHERRKNHRTAQQSKAFASSHCPPRGSGPAIVAGRTSKPEGA